MLLFKPVPRMGILQVPYKHCNLTHPYCTTHSWVIMDLLHHSHSAQLCNHGTVTSFTACTVVWSWHCYIIHSLHSCVIMTLLHHSQPPQLCNHGTVTSFTACTAVWCVIMALLHHSHPSQLCNHGSHIIHSLHSCVIMAVTSFTACTVVQSWHCCIIHSLHSCVIMTIFNISLNHTNLTPWSELGY